MGGRVYVLHRERFSGRFFAKVTLDAVVYGEVDGPGGEVAEDGGAETTIHAADAIVLEDRFDGGYNGKGGGVGGMHETRLSGTTFWLSAFPSS